MLNGKSATRVKGILDKALGPLVELPSNSIQPVRKPRVSKYSLKFFSRDDNMYSKPDSIGSSVDNELRKMKLKEKEASEQKYKGRLRQQVEKKDGGKDGQVRTRSELGGEPRGKYILRDDLD